jgi:hypothetical protein
MASLIWYDNTEAGAPVLNNVAGSLVDVLRACLITGFNSKSVASISVASGVATVNCTAHGFTTAYQKLLLIEGCSETLLNGQKQPTSVATDSFTFSVVGVADGTYGGTITTKRAPLGWTEEYTVASGAMFKRSDVTATTSMLRVLDTKTGAASTTGAYVFMVDSATDFNTYTNKVPTSDTYCLWSRGQDTATAQKWVIVGDGKRIFVLTSNASPASYGGVHPYFFGDAEFLRSGDTNGCFICGHSATNMSTTQAGMLTSQITYLNNLNLNAISGCYFQKTTDGITVGNTSSWYGVPPKTGSATSYHSPVSAPTILLGPAYVFDISGPRLRFPIYMGSSNKPHTHLTIVQPDNVSDRFLAFECSVGVVNTTETPILYIRLDGW